MAMELVTNSLAFYKDEDARIKEITTAMNVLVGEQALRRTEIMRDNGKHYTPDGSVFVQCEKFPGVSKWDTRRGVKKFLLDDYRSQITAGINFLLLKHRQAKTSSPHIVAAAHITVIYHLILLRYTVSRN